MVTGSGTSGDPYMLYNLSDLEQISTLGLSAYYELANDIDASGTQDPSYNSGAGWLPIGDSSTYFTGGFDGNGHTISGLYINRSTTDYVGIFAAFKGTIYDLTIEDPDITGQSYVGAISGSQSGTYTNIILIGGSVTGTNYVGGILGYSNSTGSTGAIILHLNYCNNISTVITGVSSVGGLVGATQYTYYLAEFNYCECSTTITGTSNVGGIVGYNGYYGYSSTNYLNYMVECKFSGIINASGESVGGITGYMTGILTGCILEEDASVTGGNYCGGIIGRGMAPGAVGAIPVKIYSCISKGSIYGGNDVGGIIGYAQSIKLGMYIYDCVFTGTVQGGDYVGGICGIISFYNPGLYLERCYSKGSITGTGNYTGGICGNFNLGHIYNSYSLSDIVGTTVAGIVYSITNSSALINYCFASGTMTGTTCKGINNSSCTVTDSYWDSEATGVTTSTGGTAKTTAEMKTASTYSTWDFSTPIWVIDSYQNDGYPYLNDVPPDPWNVYASDSTISNEQVNIPGRINLNDSAMSEEQSLISFKGFQLIDNGVDSNLVSISNNFTLNDSGTINESITFLKNLEDNCSSLETAYSYFYSLINDSNISSESLQLLNTFLLTDSRTSEENIILLKRIEDSGISDELVDCDVYCLVNDVGTSEEIASYIRQLSLLERRRMLESVLRIDNDFTLTDSILPAEELDIANVRYVGDEVNSDIQVYIDVTAVYHVVELTDVGSSTEKVNLIVRLSERDEREAELVRRRTSDDKVMGILNV